ncbi:MAG TPA: OmpA family protein [Luteolibacter sp.]
MPSGTASQRARDAAAYRLPGTDRLGRWALAGLGVSLVLHGIAFFALDKVKVAMGFEQPVSTGPIRVDRVDSAPMETVRSAEPEAVTPPPKELAPLLDDVDLFDKLPDKAEIQMRPDVLQPEFAVKVGNPAKKGDPEATSPEPVTGFNLDSDLPDIGTGSTTIPPVADGQIVVDPGSALADDVAGNKFTDNLLQKGARGTAENGSLDGSLDDVLGLPANVLVNKTTMLPSDLLFEYNSATLRESAKVGLMKLGLLIDRNPSLHCWIEGHTDLIGGEEFNLDLSRRRAEAVKEYLVRSLRIDGRKVDTRGFGKSQPLVPEGSITQQAKNRRVEIKMRPDAPPADAAPKPTAARPVEERPPAAKPVEEPAPAAKSLSEEDPSKPLLVKPKRALPVAEPPSEARPVAPRAQPVREEPVPARAKPVQEEPPVRAVPRAQVIEEEEPEIPAVPAAEPVDEDEGL